MPLEAFALASDFLRKAMHVIILCNKREYEREFGERREEREGEPETATPLAIHLFASFRVGGKTSDRAGEGTVAGVGDFGVAADLTRDGA